MRDQRDGESAIAVERVLRSGWMLPNRMVAFLRTSELKARVTKRAFDLRTFGGMRIRLFQGIVNGKEAGRHPGF